MLPAWSFIDSKNKVKVILKIKEEILSESVQNIVVLSIGTLLVNF